MSFHYPSYSSLVLIDIRLGSAKLVIIGGLAELFSGAISMGLGAYLAAVTERDHYIAEEAREREEVQTKQNAEKEEIYEIMQDYGVERDATTPLVEALAANPDEWVRVRILPPPPTCLDADRT
jgi:VIT1/CCC1 family predicted Fe2+/Mn2+ transporter